MGIMDKVVKAGNYQKSKYNSDDFESWAMDVLGWDESAFERDENNNYLDNSVAMAVVVWEHGFGCGYDVGHDTGWEVGFTCGYEEGCNL